MLVLTRKKGESIMIGDQVEVTVISVEGETVKIGLRAPRDVEIYRQEVYEAIRTTNREATTRPIPPADLSRLLPAKK